jgi:hypothetical protein
MRYCKSISVDLLFVGSCIGTGYLLVTETGQLGRLAAWIFIASLVAFWTLHFSVSYFDAPTWLIPPRYRLHAAPFRKRLSLWWRGRRSRTS